MSVNFGVLSVTTSYLHLQCRHNFIIKSNNYYFNNLPISVRHFIVMFLKSGTIKN